MQLCREMIAHVALKYERYVCDQHRERFKQEVWHNQLIPEEVYWRSGYINDFNKHRLNRIMERNKLKKKDTLLPDYGIDFLSYDNVTEKYHAGQAKCYEKSRVTAKDCITFTNSVAFHLKTTGYLYTSRDKLEAYLRENIQASCGLIEHHVLPLPDHLKELLLPDGNVAAVPAKTEQEYQLRPYQEAAIRNIEESEESKNLIKMITGSGKTLVASQVLRRKHSGQNIICIAPLIVSVEQLHQRIEPFLSETHKQHIVVDCEGTTDVDCLRKIVSEAKSRWVMYVTFKSFVEIVPLLNIDYEETFLLIDEVHNANDKLCDLANEFDQSLYMSATVPEELSDKLEFTEVFSYSIREAITDGYCVDYDVYLPYITLETSTVDVPIVQELEHLDVSLTKKALFLAKGMLYTGKRRCVVYLRSIEECVEFERVVFEVFQKYHGVDILTYRMDCTTSKKTRREILSEFERPDNEKIKIIANVRILNEAIDIVACDSVFVTKVGESIQDHTMVQRLGRALRCDKRNPTKRAAMFVWCEEWSSTINGLQLLKTEDPVFHKRMVTMSVSYDETSKRETKERERVQNGAFDKYIKIKCLTVEEMWEMRKEAWKEQYEKLGRIPSQSAKDSDERRAAEWQNTMRTAYKKGKLSQERIEALSTIEGWKWKVIETCKNYSTFSDQLLNWKTQYKKLGKPPCRSKDPEEKRAAKWQVDMRSAGDKLTQERIDTLSKVKGWEWRENTIFDDNKGHWISQYEKLGRQPSASAKDPEEKRAGKWQINMRQRHKNKKLSQEHINALSIVERWKWEEQDTFDENMAHWIAQYKKLGKIPCRSKNLEEKRAYDWQRYIRSAYQKGNLSEDRIDTLSMIKGWRWESDLYNENVSGWIKQYEKLGKKPPRQLSNDLEEKHAAVWQRDMRSAYKKGKLSQERVDELSMIEGWKWSMR